jgi:hypothetical protein
MVMRDVSRRMQQQLRKPLRLFLPTPFGQE